MRRNTDELIQFQTDYVIQWNESSISVNLLRRDDEGANLVSEHIGHSLEKSGCISLRQILEVHEERKRQEAERDKGRAELLRKFTEKVEDE